MLKVRSRTVVRLRDKRTGKTTKVTNIYKLVVTPAFLKEGQTGQVVAKLERYQFPAGSSFTIEGLTGTGVGTAGTDTLSGSFTVADGAEPGLHAIDLKTGADESRIADGFAVVGGKIKFVSAVLDPPEMWLSADTIGPVQNDYRLRPVYYPDSLRRLRITWRFNGSRRGFVTTKSPKKKILILRPPRSANTPRDSTLSLTVSGSYRRERVTFSDSVPVVFRVPDQTKVLGYVNLQGAFSEQTHWIEGIAHTLWTLKADAAVRYEIGDRNAGIMKVPSGHSTACYKLGAREGFALTIPFGHANFRKWTQKNLRWTARHEEQLESARLEGGQVKTYTYRISEEGWFEDHLWISYVDPTKNTEFKNEFYALPNGNSIYEMGNHTWYINNSMVVNNNTVKLIKLSNSGVTYKVYHGTGPTPTEIVVGDVIDP